MLVTRFPREVVRRHMFTSSSNFKMGTFKEEYERFLISMSNVVIFSSILWGFESFNEKKKYQLKCLQALDNFTHSCQHKYRNSKLDCQKLKFDLETHLNNIQK